MPYYWHWIFFIITSCFALLFGAWYTPLLYLVLPYDGTGYIHIFISWFALLLPLDILYNYILCCLIIWHWIYLYNHILFCLIIWHWIYFIFISCFALLFALDIFLLYILFCLMMVLDIFTSLYLCLPYNWHLMYFIIISCFALSLAPDIFHIYILFCLIIRHWIYFIITSCFAL